MGQNGSYSRKGGFRRAASAVEKRVRLAGEARGFAVTRLLTHWAEIVGEDTARTARPVNVSYSKGGFGATLTLLTSAAQAPMLQMQLPAIREKVNACYGYSAIARIRITQTAATGFAEGQAVFGAAEKAAATPRPSPEHHAKARDAADGVENDTLRQALVALGENVMRSSKRTS
ncbi:MAG: DUF721 domain-containing protein [Pseudomonadota bacterium]